MFVISSQTFGDRPDAYLINFARRAHASREDRSVRFGPEHAMLDPILPTAGDGGAMAPRGFRACR
jgi:hypothetical protein